MDPFVLPSVVTPPATEWTPLAIATLGIAAVGAITGVVALIRGIRNAPKPVWRVKWDAVNMSRNEDLAFEFVNHGAVAATDVAIWAGKKRWNRDNHQIQFAYQLLVRPHEPLTFKTEIPVLTEGGQEVTHMVLIYSFPPHSGKVHKKVYAFADFDYRKPFFHKWRPNAQWRLPKRWPY